MRTTSIFNGVFCRSLVIAGTLVAAWTAPAQQNARTPIKEHSPADTSSCLKEAAQMNSAVIKFGELGSQKAQNPELKRFSEQIERDHKRAQEILETIAKSHNVELPTTLSEKCQQDLNKLQALSGSEFDKEFAKDAIQGHAMGIAKLEQASTQVKDPDVAQYAKERLAQLKRHQERAREVGKAVGLDQATIASFETQPPEGVGTPGASSERGTGSPQKSEQPKQ